MMKGTTKRIRLGLLLAVATIVFVDAYAAAQQRRRPGGGRPRRSGVVLKVGQEAPDFELAPLLFKPNEKGVVVGVIGTEKVKLSDFRGKAPVCIFSSSYT